MVDKKVGFTIQMEQLGHIGKRLNSKQKLQKYFYNANSFYENVRGPFHIWSEFLCNFYLEAVIPAVLIQMA